MAMRSLRLIPAMMCLAVPATAQDIVFNPVMDPTAAMGYASIGVATEQIRRGGGGGGGVPRRAAAPMGNVRAFAQPAPAAAASAGKPYPAPSAQFRKQQVADLLDRANQSDPKSAQAMRAQFARHDYASIYDGITRPYGLAGNDAASSLAAYMVLGWMIVHEGQEPPAAGLRGVRAQAAQALSDPRLAAPEMRAKLGEEFKILFVTLHAGWQGARREGTLDQYSAGVARLFNQKNGMNLAAARIGPRGFEGG
jgi:hypothetical protein